VKHGVLKLVSFNSKVMEGDGHNDLLYPNFSECGKLNVDEQ
jgi:hypothetical protein